MANQKKLKLSCLACGNTRAASYFRIPVKENLKRIWLKKLQISSPSAVPSSARICENHFSLESFSQPKKGTDVQRRRLKVTAVPQQYTGPSRKRPVVQQDTHTQPRNSDENEMKSDEGQESCSMSTPEEQDTRTQPRNTDENEMKSDEGRESCSMSTSGEVWIVSEIETPVAESSSQPPESCSTPTTHYRSSTSDHQYAGNDMRCRRVLEPRYVGDIRTPHLSTPRRAKRYFLMTKKVVMDQRQTIKKLSKDLRNARKKIDNLEHLITHLKSKNLLSENSANNLMATTPDILRSIALRSKLSKKAKYSADLRKFALSLQFYSTKAYLYVRKAFGNLLPGLSTIRGYCTVLDMEAGISKDVLTTLQVMGTQKGKPIVCNFVADEMALKEHTVRKGDKRYGYVNLGVNYNEPEHAADMDLEKANHALVFLLTALNDKWKVPVAHFLIRHLTAEERANLIRITLSLMHEHNVHCYSITMDGVITNIAVANILGAVMDTQDPNYHPYFNHPATGDKVFVFIDPSHDIKNVRNAFGTTFNEKTSFETPFHDAAGNLITWRHIHDLNEVQKDEGVHLANKITDRHIKFAENKMNVRLAVQTLSNSVGDSLTFLRTATDVVTPYEFSDSLGSSIFCKHFNDIFDFLNCRTRYKTQMNKQPYRVALTRANYCDMKKWAEEKISYIKGLHQDGIKLTAFRRKCGFESFISCLKNIFELFDVLEQKHNFEYLLSYKLLQDMIETFFSAIRMCGGFCNNPTSFQFGTAIRRLSIHASIVWSSESNCMDDDMPILQVSSRNKATPVEDDEEDDEHMVVNMELFNFQNVTVPSAFVQHVVRYISGYIVCQLKMSRSKDSCPECLDFATEPCGTSLLADVKNRGPLKYASEGVIAVGMLVEGMMRTNKDDVLRPNFAKQCVNALLIQ